MNSLEDIEQRIASKDYETPIEALREALNHGQAGLKLVRDPLVYKLGKIDSTS